MKRNILSLFIVFSISLFTISCSKDDTDKQNVNETANLELVTILINNNHKVEIYNSNGQLNNGYNEIFVRIKDNAGTYINNASLEWNPVMHMMSMSHSCPYSAITRVLGTQTLYSGYIIFQMAGNESEYWELTINYTIGGKNFSVQGRINVSQSEKRTLNVFTGTDGVKYILAMIEPAVPKVAVNTMTAVLYKMESMSAFTVADNFRIKIDPRMPGMNNHTSPNNKALTQSNTGGVYKGALSLTMTGYWKINLQLEDAQGNLLKGEPVTETNESSSIWFEIEF
ncbi:FixH family protein [Chitinophaga tropicalis]|uniref:YtkA-like domain-containing protein n=1 Tax=Chitinophaga tropicalis TaxID=2683588 RepID=A0A7K1U360_9BACT|nr:FixH family protein [Chitinophaga tropicalis]MVT08750.1 hypothetical protein [Chitinophaga tropicalis]